MSTTNVDAATLADRLAAAETERDDYRRRYEHELAEKVMVLQEARALAVEAKGILLDMQAMRAARDRLVDQIHTELMPISTEWMPEDLLETPIGPNAAESDH